MISDYKVIEIYSFADDFMQLFSAELQKRTVSISKSSRAGRKSIMRDAEVITILVLFHLKGYCRMKHFTPQLHLICNNRGEILNFVFTPANVDDREPLGYENFIKDIYGKLVGDKGSSSLNASLSMVFR